MSSKLFIPALITCTLGLPMVAQSDYEYNLARHKGNKIVLLGEKSTAEMGVWRNVVDSEEIYGHGFVLLNRQAIVNDSYFGITERTIGTFETWFRQKYGLSNNARWAVLDMKNSLIVSGVETPQAKELDQLLDQRGIKTPIRQTRDFLQTNPDHLDAKADLLNEARRRALHVMPSGVTEDLDTESDLRTWAVFANETDKVFTGSWLGIEIQFFRINQEQPERHSKLMRDVFKKHVSKIEEAVRANPLNGVLWNIWAWMARSMSDYRWETFIDSIEPVRFPYYNIQRSVPAPEVSMWLVDEFRKKSEWEKIDKIARNGRTFSGYSAGVIKVEWIPGGTTNAFGADTNHIKDYPAKSAYAPHLEALLKLGRVDEANNIYDELIRIEGKEDRYSKSIIVNGKSERYKANNAKIAADVAVSAGMEDIAKIWEQGELIDKSPWVSRGPFGDNGFPSFYYYSNSSNDYYKSFSDIANNLPVVLRIQGVARAVDSLGWKGDDGDRWALIGGDLRVIDQGRGLPDLDTLEASLYRNGIKDVTEYMRTYLSEHGSQPGLELDLAITLIENFGNRQSNKGDQAEHDDPYVEACRSFHRILNNHPDTIINIPSMVVRGDNARESQSMKLVSKPLLTRLESLLEAKPSSYSLWSQWLFWRWIEGTQRPIVPIIERIKPSPLSTPGTVPPFNVINTYYDECKRDEKWDKVVELLKTVWEREFTRIIDLQSENPDFKVSDIVAERYTFTSIDDVKSHQIQRSSATMGDRVGVPLIEAYLNDNKPNDAEEIFNAWINCGGKFFSFTKTIDLAKEKGYERLSREWEERLTM